MPLYAFKNKRRQIIKRTMHSNLENEIGGFKLIVFDPLFFENFNQFSENNAPCIGSYRYIMLICFKAYYKVK